ncbi:hypothetical protein [Siminovitchia acidinfaciens]|nr:hypothetical protein [Siminovitchia acidinfaciens]
MKEIVLSAGKGTKFQPFFFAQPKTYLPVANRLVVQYTWRK